jgi:threonine dehydrogenase-like Zn-dependent dehydrogenase
MGQLLEPWSGHPNITTECLMRCLMHQNAHCSLELCNYKKMMAKGMTWSVASRGAFVWGTHAAGVALPKGPTPWFVHLSARSKRQLLTSTTSTANTQHHQQVNGVPEHANVVVVGGGIIGTSVAYHLRIKL